MMHFFELVEGYARDVRVEIDNILAGLPALSPMDAAELFSRNPEFAMEAREWRLHDDVESAVHSASRLHLISSDPTLLEVERAWQVVFELAVSELVRHSGEAVVRAFLTHLATSEETMAPILDERGQAEGVVIDWLKFSARHLDDRR